MNTFIPTGFVRASVILGAHVRVIESYLHPEMTLEHAKLSGFAMFNFEDKTQCAKRYSYLAGIDQGIAAGDIVLCETRYGVCLGKVAELPESDMSYNKPLKRIITKVDLDYMLEPALRAVKVKSLQDQLSALKKRFEERALFEMMAEKMPEARALLDQLAKLE